MTKLQTVAGTVSALDVGYGMEYPTITVNKLQIKVAPVWYLLEKGFEIKVGDAVTLSAAPSKLASDSYLYAVEITKTVSRLKLTLRDTSGVPLWTGGNGAGGGQMGGGHGNGGPMAEGGCLDASTIATAAGVIDKISAGAGIQMPALTLKTADGKLLTFKLGPERSLLAADVELKVGDKIAVKYAVETCNDELVALTITTSTGVIIRLRNDDCTPSW